MRVIHKFPLQCVDEQIVEMPIGAQILSVQVQRGTICIWATVDVGIPKRPRRFRIIGTGHEFVAFAAEYLGTVQLADGSLVFHVFDCGAT